MDAAPNWFSVSSRGPTLVEGVCTVIDDTATSDEDYSITIESVAGEVYARETKPGEKLPLACFNRHIMPGGLFCVGLNAGRSVRTAKDARDWWSNLSQFLRLQGVASATKRWPRGMELDHGAAGNHHKAALDAAAKLGVAEEYELALLGQKSWITSMLSRDGKRIINGRAPCPVGCTHKGRRRLRCECCAAPVVLDLLQSERRRSVALAKFWEGLRSAESMVCCQTMIDCPLKNRKAA